MENQGRSIKSYCTVEKFKQMMKNASDHNYNPFEGKTFEEITDNELCELGAISSYNFCFDKANLFGWPVAAEMRPYPEMNKEDVGGIITALSDSLYEECIKRGIPVD